MLLCAVSAGKSSLDAATSNGNDPNLKFVPVASCCPSYLSSTVPQASSLTTLMEGSSVTAHQAVLPQVSGRQVVANGSGQAGTPYARQILLHRAMQQLQQQGGQLKRVPRQLVSNGAMAGLGASASGTSWAAGQGSASAYGAMFLKSVQAKGLVGQGQSMVLSPQLSAVGNGGYAGPVNGLPAKVDDTGSSMNLRVTTRSSQMPIQYNGVTGESKNLSRGLLNANGVPLLASSDVKPDGPSVGIVSNLANAGVALSSPRPVTQASQDQQHPGAQFQATNGNSSSVASTDGPGASQNGTPESNNPAEKSVAALGSFDTVRDGVDHGIDKGLGACFGTGENCDLENGGGALDDGSAGSPFKGSWQESLQSPFCEILRAPSPGVYGDALKFDSLDLELDL